MGMYDDVRDEIIEYYNSMNEAKARCDVIIAQKEAEAKDALALHPENYLPGQTWEIISRTLIRDDPDFKVWSGKYGFRREHMLALLAFHNDMQQQMVINRLNRVIELLTK